MNPARLNDELAQAQAQARAGRLTEAETRYRGIMAAYPKYHPVYQEFGLLAYAAGNLPLAAELFKTAISLAQHNAIYHRNYGEICRRMGRFDAAIHSGMMACRLAPDDVDAHFNLGLAFSDALQPDRAAAVYGNVLNLLSPVVSSGIATANAWNMCGICFHRLRRFDEARNSYQRALQLQADSPSFHNSLGSLLSEMGLLSQALDCFATAVKLAPEFAMARLNLGMAQLKLGDWQPGWENYEARWQGSAESGNGTFSRPYCPLPQWDGQSATEAQNLLVYTEQGYGDLFQFSRFLEPVTQRFAKVGLVCPDTITHLLMEWSFGEKVVLLKCLPAETATWHWHCPLMSLPRAFRTLPDSVPCRIPYLKVSALAKAHWQSRLSAVTTGHFRVGVAWSGRKTHQYDSLRSLRFEQLLPLLEDRRINWINLQKTAPGEPRPGIPAQLNWIDWSDELTDFADTAALLSNLDLVISIDSALVHLAGALGRPVWMLNRFAGEWRWMEARTDSPWYPTLRIFNQPEYADWVSVLNTVKTCLAEYLTEKI